MKLGDYEDMDPKPSGLPVVRPWCCHTLLPPTVPTCSLWTGAWDTSVPNHLSQLPGLTGRNLWIKTIVGIKGKQPVFRCHSSTASALLLHTRSPSVCREPEWHVSTGLHRAAPHLLWTGGKRSRNVRKEDATVSTCVPLSRLLSRQPLPCSLVQQTWKVGAKGTGCKGQGE